MNPTPYCPALRLSSLLLPVPRLEMPFRSSAEKLPSFLTSNAGPCSLAQLSLKTGPLSSWDRLSRMRWISVDPESSAFWMSSLPSYNVFSLFIEYLGSMHCPINMRTLHESKPFAKNEII